MTILGAIMQLVTSGILTLAPAAVLKKDQMWISVALSFLAILATSYIGGLISAVPVAVFLLVFSLWVRFVGHDSARAKRILFTVTIVLTALFFAQHLVHLPIRFALNQPPFKIASNVAGIFLSAAMLCVTLELQMVRKKNRCDKTP